MQFWFRGDPKCAVAVRVWPQGGQVEFRSTGKCHPRREKISNFGGGSRRCVPSGNMQIIAVFGLCKNVCVWINCWVGLVPKMFWGIVFLTTCWVGLAGWLAVADGRGRSCGDGQGNFMCRTFLREILWRTVVSSLNMHFLVRSSKIIFKIKYCFFYKFEKLWVCNWLLQYQIWNLLVGGVSAGKPHSVISVSFVLLFLLLKLPP